ncbi:hypothetical protein [Motiliproteus sp. SC1-56]|uniref:hypothetical protein n=1 Tax=Motiliproteus sp. SC1-56 TaxID=2799565 RepID=UPI001A8FD94C|nr:hypothetical protein [Motiliproteus sp. SC1-56]
MAQLSNRLSHLFRLFPWILCLMLAGHSWAQGVAVDPASTCPHCPAVLDDIQASLKARCDRVPSREALRREPIYVFLSIYQQVSQGVSARIRNKVYDAALAGMTCDNYSTGIDRANQVARELYHP